MRRLSSWAGPAGRREALQVLRQGSDHALETEGAGRAAAALARLGRWDELRALGERRGGAAWEEEGFARAALGEPGMGAEGMVRVVGRAKEEARGMLLEEAAKRLREEERKKRRGGGGGGKEREKSKEKKEAKVGPGGGEGELLLAWAKDMGQEPGPELARLAAREMAAQGRWEEALTALGEHGQAVEDSEAAEWMYGAPLAWANKLGIALGGGSDRGGKLAGARAAAEGGAAGWLEKASSKEGAAEQCLLLLAQKRSGAELLRMATRVVAWCGTRSVLIAVSAVGRVCLRLAHDGDVEGVTQMLAAVERPDAFCFGALVNAFAQRGDFASARKSIERMIEGGVQPSFLTFRHLLDRMEGQKDQLEVFARADALVRLDVTAINKWMHALFRFGKWEQALALLDDRPFVPDIVTYITLVSGLSELDRPKEAMAVALRMMNDGNVAANEVAFCALRAFCKTHGFERQWPTMRAWAAEHGVHVGSISNTWRDAVLDPVSSNKAGFKFPK